jgi:hypothetical protein
MLGGLVDATQDAATQDVLADAIGSECWCGNCLTCRASEFREELNRFAQAVREDDRRQIRQALQDIKEGRLSPSAPNPDPQILLLQEAGVLQALGYRIARKP